jgi:hypothetical protein
MESHHDLAKVGEVIMGMRTAAALSEHHKHPDGLQGIMQALFLTATAACVKHTELVYPEDHTLDNQKKALATLGLLMPEARWNMGAVASLSWTGLVPGPPPGDSSGSGVNSAPSTGKSKKAKKWNWDDDLGGEWRQEPKVPHNGARTRGVKVKIDGPNNWAILEGDVLQQVLHFYDNASVMDTLQNVECMPGRSYDVRFEGGMYMTQRSTKYETVREMHVVYLPTPAQA